MATGQRQSDGESEVRRAWAAAWTALKQLAGGLGTALLALGVLLCLLLVAVACLIGIGLLLVPGAARTLRAVADRERVRLSRWGPPVLGPGPVPDGRRRVLADPILRAELRWLTTHATLGLFVSLFGLLLPLFAVKDLTLPLWWWPLPPGEVTASVGFTVRNWPTAFAVMLLGLAWAAATVELPPRMARWQARQGRRLLEAQPDVDLSLRVAELTASRAEALDAHATELRRIERSLHDGTQNRLVGVNVLLGAARRKLATDPAGADELLERAQGAAEQALAELRAVARGILPPVLADRGLAGALAGLAADCPIPCRTQVEASARCAASVEAAAYFVVAEALTNAARHSHADAVEVTVRRRRDRLQIQIRDDGSGGADESRGSGLAGIRARVSAHDGNLRLTSPAGGPTTLEVELPCGS